jgi:hypothetical protein
MREERGVLGRERESAERGRAPGSAPPFLWVRRLCGDGDEEMGGGVGRVVRGTTRRHEVGEGGLVPTGRRCPDRERPGLDATAARTGERKGPLTHGPRPAAGGRGEEWGRMGRPEGKRSGPSPKKQENFLFIQIKFKQVQTVLIKG